MGRVVPEQKPLTFEWFDGLRIGHPQIDEDHRKLIEIINVVSEAIVNKDSNLCDQMLAAFLQVAKNHFAMEEKILFDIGYPDAQSHADYHRDLMSKASDISDLCSNAADNDKLRECFNEMVDFLAQDILKGDLEFVPYMTNKGLIK